MASSKAYYWVALAVLALGINGEYQRGRMQPLHNLLNRSAAMVNCLALRAQEYVSLARFFVGGSPKAPPTTEWAHVLREERGNFSRLEAELAQRQSDFARLGSDRAQIVRLTTKIGKHQAQFARLQARRAQMVIRAENARRSVSCNDGEVKVMIDADSADMPDIPEVPDTF